MYAYIYVYVYCRCSEKSAELGMFQAFLLLQRFQVFPIAEICNLFNVCYLNPRPLTCGTCCCCCLNIFVHMFCHLCYHCRSTCLSYMLLNVRAELSSHKKLYA